MKNLKDKINPKIFGMLSIAGLIVIILFWCIMGYFMEYEFNKVGWTFNNYIPITIIIPNLFMGYSLGHFVGRLVVIIYRKLDKNYK